MMTLHLVASVHDSKMFCLQDPGYICRPEKKSRTHLHLIEFNTAMDVLGGNGGRAREEGK